MWDFSIFQSGDTWVALLTLTILEIVLGIDNIIFISILTDRLPPSQQQRTRTIGLALALLMRLGLLFAITWIMGLTEPLFAIAGQSFSGRDLILGLGGLFLVGKATHEIYAKLEVSEEEAGGGRRLASASIALLQILLLDLVFSLDSVITAVGMAKHILIMVIAMVVAVGVMLVFVKPISDFVNRHPSMKVLALSFLLLIGVVLISEAVDQPINKAYIYFAMAFAFGIELLNLRLRKKSRHKPVHLHDHAPGD